jgi:signal transduction histidine kinase
VVVEFIRVNGRTIDRNSELTFDYDENDLSIDFLGLWYRDPENVKYQYKMENFDPDSIITSDNRVTYSKLPPGEYSFALSGYVNGARPPTRASLLTFRIRPPFWRTNAFYLFAVITLTAAGYGIIRYRERKLVYDKLVLERRVEERTREIQKNTEEIQAQNEEIMAQAEEIKGINENLEMLVHQRTAELEKKNRALEEYAFINAHKLRSPVASIMGLVNLLSKTNLDGEAKAINQHLKQSADELDSIVRSITQAIERGEK